MLEGVGALVTYLFLKLGGYSVWSYVGFRWFDSQRKSLVLHSLGLGVARLVVGWGAGIMVAPFALVAAGATGLPVFYFTVLVVVRWFEWGIIQCWFPFADGALGVFVHGATRDGRVWRVVGILVSYLADAPFLLVGGFPHGRILC
jgi:hypothetical protein